MGLDLDKNTESIDLECRDAGFYYQEQKVTDMNKATCIRVMEPEIIKEEQSDCSKGFGADGESDALDISLVKVGWNFNGNFEEQVNLFHNSIASLLKSLSYPLPKLENQLTKMPISYFQSHFLKPKIRQIFPK